MNVNHKYLGVLRHSQIIGAKLTLSTLKRMVYWKN